jgi:NADH:ubiquinone oxidoreductase subunit E
MDFEPSELVETIERNGIGASLISVLEEVQTRYHYLPREAMILVSEWLGMPLSQVYSVATFYHAFSLVPRGKHKICVCTGTACHVRGAVQVLDRLKDDEYEGQMTTKKVDKLLKRAMRQVGEEQ